MSEKNDFSIFSDFGLKKPFPDELLNLYNPAYVASVLFIAGRACQQKRRESVSVYFPYLAFPLVCIDACRERLPAKVTKLPLWIRQHADVLYDFPTRVRALRPFVSSGLIFLYKQKLVEPEPTTGRLKYPSGKKFLEQFKRVTFSSEAVRDEFDKAPVAGRLLASGGDESAVLAAFGMRP